MTSRPAEATTASVADYLANAHVRHRIVEYCGGSRSRPPTAAYIAFLDRAAAGVPSWADVVRVPPGRLGEALSGSSDVARSLWDAEHLLFFLELDYLNTDVPAEPFLHPADVLLKMEPAYIAARAVFSRIGLNARAFVTGRGYHFIGQIRLDDPLIGALAALVPATPPWHANVDVRRPAGVTAPLSQEQARAADGIGCLIEFAAHLILSEARGSVPPVVFNGTAVGHTGPLGRECISIDFSHVGDPLDIRHARVGFGTYQWHRLRPDIFGERAAAVEPLVSLPRGRESATSLLARGRSLTAGLAAARRGTARLPNVRRGVENLRAIYTRSRLASFHREYYAELDASGRRPLNRAALAPCVAAAFARPNDLLLKPEHIQHAVRWLMSRGWRPAAIARLLQSVYETDHHWGDRWTARMHPRARAEFEVRVFAGLLETGGDPLIDFNCVSAQEKGLCPGVPCRSDLRTNRDALLHAV